MRDRPSVIVHTHQIAAIFLFCLRTVRPSIALRHVNEQNPGPWIRRILNPFDLNSHDRWIGESFHTVTHTILEVGKVRDSENLERVIRFALVRPDTKYDDPTLCIRK